MVLSSAYVQGSALSSTDTFSGQTLASLGITAGTYNYTVGTGTDTLTIFAGVPVVAAVPEPATLALGGLSLPALGLFIWKRRKLASGGSTKLR